MANHYAVDYKKRHVTLPAKLTEVATNGGRMRVLYDTYTTASVAKDELMYFGKLPPGAEVWEAQLHVSATLGNNATLSLGYTDGTTTSAAAFLAVLAATTADQSRYYSGGATTATNKIGVAGIAPVSITNESQVILTHSQSSGSAAASDDVVISVKIVYSVD